jgi:hypothetical protein
MVAHQRSMATESMVDIHDVSLKGVLVEATLCCKSSELWALARQEKKSTKVLLLYLTIFNDPMVIGIWPPPWWKVLYAM